MSNLPPVVLAVLVIVGLGFGTAAFIAWWSMRGETYRRRG
jgi:hypothetical protein